MKSKTKTLPTDAVLGDMLKQAGLNSAGVQFRLLGDGMFNAVFAAETNPPVVMKIAPRPQVPVMTYERDMLATELYWYDQIRQHTEITVPDILYSDPAGNLCGAPWVVMERLPGVHRDKCPLPSTEKHRRTAEMVAQIHNVSGTGYGYVQNGLYENWADAYISMIENLLADARRMGKTSRRGQRLLAYARQYRAVLAAAPCVMVNFDLWSSNILCHTVDGQTRFAWIDPERSLWGGPGAGLFAAGVLYRAAGQKDFVLGSPQCPLPGTGASQPRDPAALRLCPGAAGVDPGSGKILSLYALEPGLDGGYRWCFCGLQGGLCRFAPWVRAGAKRRRTRHRR